MSFDIQQKEDVAVISVTASRLDAHVAPELKQRVSEIVESGTTRILLDLESVQFMDSSGLGSVIASFKLTGQKGEFIICNMGETVKELFVLTHMDSLFDVYESKDEGLQQLCA